MVVSAAESQSGDLTVEVFVLLSELLKYLVLSVFYFSCFLIDPFQQLFLKLHYLSLEAFGCLPHEDGCLTYFPLLCLQLH